jgi:polyhydroxyalkanoate synthesis regulator phasin
MATPSFNFDPFSQFNVEPSSFSLPAGMTMDQAATMNAMTQPVSALSPEALAGLGLGGNFYANKIAQNTAARQGFQLVGSPQTTSTAGRLIGSTPPQYTGPTPGRFVSGTQMVPTGQAPAVSSYGGSPAVRPAQVTSIRTVPGAAAVASGASKLARFGSPGTLLYGGADLLTELITGRGLSERIGEGVGGAVGDFLFPGATYLPPFTNAGTLAELAEMSAPVDRDRDPIRATYQLGPDYNNETIMERESGEIFAPSASQLESFMSGMEAASQPTATGIGPGGSEGVVFGGGRAPMSQDETRAMLQERFGAPTISEIQNLPSGQGMGMMTDAQGRMISQGDDRTAFDLASQDRIDRLEARPDFMTAYSNQELRDIAEAGQTEVSVRGGKMSFEEARKFVPKGQKETTKAYNQRIKAFQSQQNSTLNKLKEQYEQYRVSGQGINNERLEALAAQYQQTEPEKYREAVQVAQEMLRRGTLQDEIQAAMYVVDIMGGKVSDIFDPDRPIPVDVDNIPSGAKEQLISDPSLRDLFDAKYGKGASDKVLGN